MASQGTDRHIWGDDDQSRACCGRLKKRHLCGLGALLAASAVVVGLSVGLTVDVTGNSDAVGQATDEAAIGCFNDRRRSRVLSNRLTDDAMTPQVCRQYGAECVCVCVCSYLSVVSMPTYPRTVLRKKESQRCRRVQAPACVHISLENP